MLHLSTAAGVAFVEPAPAQGALGPVPAWPPDGNLPDNLKNNYVFLGPTLGQIVVSYPASLDDPGATGRKTFTFRLHNLVQPLVAVQIARDRNGVYTYDYVLGNGGSATQAIRSWSFAGPGDDAGFEVTRPGWSARVRESAFAKQMAVGTVLQRPAEVMFHSRSGNEIVPGTNVDAFHVASTYSPGFTSAFFRSGFAFDLPSEMPKVVADQVGVLARPEWDSRVAIILSPVFPPGSSAQGIAADFHIGISKLVAAGTLSANSSFVKEALTALSGMVLSGDTSPLSDIVKRLPAPSAGIEAEIAIAMGVGRQ
jgi:hypothetical protein